MILHVYSMDSVGSIQFLQEKLHSDQVDNTEWLLVKLYSLLVSSLPLCLVS